MAQRGTEDYSSNLFYSLRSSICPSYITLELILACVILGEDVVTPAGDATYYTNIPRIYYETSRDTRLVFVR